MGTIQSILTQLCDRIAATGAAIRQNLFGLNEKILFLLFPYIRY